jgi:hypothetical protein
VPTCGGVGGGLVVVELDGDGGDQVKLVEGAAGLLSACSSRSPRLTVRTISMVSRVVCTGLRNRTPCQPSITRGPEVPMPKMKRPADSSCKLKADVASSAGVREPNCTTNVPSLIDDVLAARYASPVSAS